MKRLLLLVSFLVIAISAISQNVSDSTKVKNEVYNPGDYVPPKPIDPSLSNSQRAGIQLMKFANSAQLGIAMEIAGGALIYASAQSDSEEKEAAMIVGAGVGIIGFFIHVFSYSNARNAGKLLKIGDNITVKPSQQGIGVAIPIK